MKKLILAAAVLATFSFTAIEVANWGIDASHSRLGFTLNHQGIAEMQGEFKKVDVTVTASAADFSDAKIELTAQANSINTGSEGRDGHLQTPDFLDAAQFPTITFKSSSMKKVGEKDYVVSGELQSLDIKRVVSNPSIIKSLGWSPEVSIYALADMMMEKKI